MSNLTERLHGVIPPIVTPLTTERTFDQASAEKLCGAMLDWGVHGLFALGTSGEGPFLRQADREGIVRTAISVAAGKVPVLVGVLAPGTAEAIEQAKFAATAGADALVVAAPYYYSMDQAGILEHFRCIRKAVDLPVLAYDIPSTTHVKLSVETLLELAAEGGIIGVKDSSGQFDSFRRLIVKSDGRLKLFTGSELQVDAVLHEGGVGVVPGMGNVAAHGFVALYNAFRAGDEATVRQLQERIVRLFDVFLRADGTLDISSAIGAMKAALYLRGIIATTTTSLPFRPLTPADIERVRSILVETEFL